MPPDRPNSAASTPGARPPDPEELLAHAGWMRRLALELVGDPTRAEDLVQDTWLVAITRAPRARAALRRWLARVLQNSARQSWRGERRRAAREESRARPEGGASTDELIEAVDAQRTVVSELLQLAEPYRSVLVLRYFQDLDAAEIARRRGQPAATVRSQLARGLALLRGRMDARDEPGRANWAVLLLPILRPARPLLPQASLSLPLAATGITTMHILAKIAIASALAGVAYVGWSALERPAPEPLQQPALLPTQTRAEPLDELAPASVREESARAEVPEAVSDPVASPGPRAPEAQAAPAAAAVPSAVVEAHFVDHLGLPVADVELRLVPNASGEATVCRSDSGGVAHTPVELAHVGRRAYWASWRSPQRESGERSLVLEAGEVLHMGTVTLAPAARVEGRVLDPEGRPLPGVAVYWEAGPVPETEPYLLRRFGSERRHATGSVEGGAPTTAAKTDEAGQYQLDGVSTAGVVIWASEPGRRLDWSELFVLSPGEVLRGVDLVLAELEPEDHIAGRVTGPEGEPLPEAVVRYQFNSEDLGMSGGIHLEPDGSFDFLVHRPVAHSFDAALAGGSLTPARSEGVLPGTLDLELQLGVQPTVPLLVVDEEGEPIERFALNFITLTESGNFGTGEGTHDYPGGRIDFPPGSSTFLLQVQAAGFAPAEAGPFVNGVVPGSQIDLVLKRVPTVRGLVTAGGEPVAGAAVFFAPLIDGDVFVEINGYASQLRSLGARARTDASGHFELTPEHYGAHRLRAEAPTPEAGELPRFAPAELGPLWVVEGQALEELELELSAAGTIRVHVRRADGLDPAGTLVSFNRYDGHPLVLVADGQGEVRASGLMPGGWAIAVAHRQLSPSSSSSSSGSGARSEWPIDCVLRAGDTSSFELLVPAASSEK